MNRVVFSPAAQIDLEQIWDYTNGQGADQANKYIRVLQRAVERLADNPLIGRACDEVGDGYRRHAAGSHTIYYRITNELIVVVRVLHQRMDVDRQFDE